MLLTAHCSETIASIDCYLNITFSKSIPRNLIAYPWKTDFHSISCLRGPHKDFYILHITLFLPRAIIDIITMERLFVFLTPFQIIKIPIRNILVFRFLYNTLLYAYFTFYAHALLPLLIFSTCVLSPIIVLSSVWKL